MSTAATLRPRSVTAGLVLPNVSLQVSYATVASVLGATWDSFPGHHDPEFARAQGQQDIYLNTFALAGILDRIALEWAGPEWFIRRRAMRMTASVYPGDTLVGSGTVTETGALEDGTPYVRLSLTAATEGAGPCVSSDTTIVLPDPLPEERHP